MVSWKATEKQTKLYEFGNRKCVSVERMTANGKQTQNCMEMSVCTIASAFKWADFPKEALVTGMYHVGAGLQHQRCSFLGDTKDKYSMCRKEILL